MNKTTAGIARAILAASTVFASAATLALVADPSSAWAQEAGFTAIGSHAQYRVDGVRDGVHKGADVRFVDMTLKHLAPETTFVGSIQEVWWQGRTVGSEVQPLRRDGQPFGMHGQYVRQGEVVAVSYPVPVREDVTGVTVEYPDPGPGPKKRFFSWAELAAARR
jgi:hypothetical protein